MRCRQEFGDAYKIEVEIIKSFRTVKLERVKEYGACKCI